MKEWFLQELMLWRGNSDTTCRAFHIQEKKQSAETISDTRKQQLATNIMDCTYYKAITVLDLPDDV